MPKPAFKFLLINIAFGKVAPRAGFEPATNRLTAGCSTTELPGNSAQLFDARPIAKEKQFCQGVKTYFHQKFQLLCILREIFIRFVLNSG